MSQNKQNLRKAKTLQKCRLDPMNQITTGQNTISQRTRRQVVNLKEKISNYNNNLDKDTNAMQQIVEGGITEISKPCFSYKISKEKIFHDEQNFEGLEKKRKFSPGEDQIQKKKSENLSEQFQKYEKQNLILNLIALQARSELRFELDWKKHELWNEEMPQMNNKQCNILNDESNNLDSVICYSFFSNDNEKLEDCLKKHKYNEVKLEEQYMDDLSQIKIKENNLINEDQNQKRQVLQIKTLITEVQQSSLNQSNHSDEIEKFYHFLNQAIYENPSRASCKEIHKLIRQRFDKSCVDVFLIDVIWSELQQSKEIKVLSFQQFLKCIQDMHEQDLLWLDKLGRKVYLI